MPGKPRFKGRLDRATVAQKRSDASGYQTVSRERWPDFFSTGRIFRIRVSDGSLRVYVIVEPGERSSRCLMIKTYSGQATTRPDVRCRQNEHAVIYTMAQPPKPLRGEDKLRQPIGARADKQAQPFSPRTRLNYGQEVDVAHTEPVCLLGHVLERDLSVLVADYLKVQGRLKERRIILATPLPSFSPPVTQSRGDSVDTMANDPPDDLSLAPEEETGSVLPLSNQHHGAPEAFDCPPASEFDQNDVIQNMDQTEEFCDIVDANDRLLFDDLDSGASHEQPESAEQHTPLLLKWNESEEESQLDTMVSEDPVEHQGTAITNDTDLSTIEFPTIDKEADVPTVDENTSLDHGADADPGLDDSTLDVSGTGDLDDPEDHGDASSNSSPGSFEPDSNLGGPVEKIDSIQDEGKEAFDSIYRILDEAEDLEPSEPSEPSIQASSRNPLDYQSHTESLETSHEIVIESPYCIRTQSTPSVSPGMHPRPDWWDEWFQLAPHEIRACTYNRKTTPERQDSTHTTTTEEKAERSLSPEVADLNASTGLTASYHTSATELETKPASEACGEMHETEPTVSDSVSPTAAQDTSADPFSPDSSEQGLDALDLAGSPPIAPQPSHSSSPVSPLSAISHPVLNLPPSPALSPKLSPTPSPPRSCPPEPDPVPPRRYAQRDRAQGRGQDRYTPQSRQSAPRQPSQYPFPTPQQYYAPPQPAFALPGNFPDASGPSMWGGYWSSHGIYQQTPPLYPAISHPTTPHPTYFARQGPTPDPYASTPYHPTYSTRCDPHHQHQQHQQHQHQQHQQQQQQQQQQKPLPQNHHHHHHHTEKPRPTTPEPSEVTDSSSAASSSSSSAAEFEKEVYFYNNRAEKTLLYALLDTGADRNFIRLDKALAAGLELRPVAHLNFWAGDGSVVRPKYVAGGSRWRFVRKGGGIIWTDEFVVLEHMPRDVILGNEVIVKRSFLLSNETLCVLGLEALTLTKEQRRMREEEERRKRLSDQERIKQQNLETRQQLIEKRQRKKLLQPKPEESKDTEDEWYDCEEDSSVVATVGSRP